jgi:hypothetical protein
MNLILSNAWLEDLAISDEIRIKLRRLIVTACRQVALDSWYIVIHVDEAGFK